MLKIGVPEADVDRLARHYYSTYGLTVRGLMVNHQIDPVDFDAFVDGSLELDKVMGYDAALRAMIEAIPAEKWIFTNAGLYADVASAFPLVDSMRFRVPLSLPIFLY